MEFVAVVEKCAAGIQKSVFKIMGGGGGGSSRIGGVGGDPAVVAERDQLRSEVMVLRSQIEEAGGGSMRRVEELEELLGEREGKLREAQNMVSQLEGEVGALAKANQMVEEALREALDKVEALQRGMGSGEEGTDGIIGDLQKQVEVMRLKSKEEGEALSVARGVEEGLRQKIAKMEGEIARSNHVTSAGAGEGGGGDYDAVCAELTALKDKYKTLEEEHNDLLILLAENNEDEDEDEDEEERGE